jgi:hypothetical protein
MAQASKQASTHRAGVCVYSGAAFTICSPVLDRFPRNLRNPVHTLIYLYVTGPEQHAPRKLIGTYKAPKAPGERRRPHAPSVRGAVSQYVLYV